MAADNPCSSARRRHLGCSHRPSAARGARRIVALTHGHESCWAALPGARALLRQIGDHVDVLTYLGEYFRIRLARGLDPAAAARLVRLAPGVDNESFRPGAGGAAIREHLGITPAAPRCPVCLPDGAAQGPGHADQGLAAGPGRAGRRAARAGAPRSGSKGRCGCAAGPAICGRRPVRG